MKFLGHTYCLNHNHCCTGINILDGYQIKIDFICTFDGYFTAVVSEFSKVHQIVKSTNWIQNWLQFQLPIDYNFSFKNWLQEY